MIANSNQIIDADTAELVATTLGHSVNKMKVLKLYYNISSLLK